MWKQQDDSRSRINNKDGIDQEMIGIDTGDIQFRPEQNGRGSRCRNWRARNVYPDETEEEVFDINNNHLRPEQNDRRSHSRNWRARNTEPNEMDWEENDRRSRSRSANRVGIDHDEEIFQNSQNNFNIRPDPENMAYAAVANKDKAAFYVAKGWHNRFAGPRGANLAEAQKQFKVKIKMARRETPDTGIYVEGEPKAVEGVRRHFERVVGFSIGTTPLQESKCNIVPLEIAKLTEKRDSYIALVQKHGVAVAFPRAGSGDGFTMIQGQAKDIANVLAAFGKVLGREVKVEVEEQKSDGKAVAVSNRRFHKTMSRLSMDYNEVLFFHPRENDDPDFERFLEVLSTAEHTLDICVFTITDNRIRYCLQNEKRHGVKVRIITDNSQAESLGSDSHWLNKNAGIPVKVDYDPNEQSHMHHKFCVIDSRVVMTGSFNWTRSASDKNYENIMITSQKDCVRQYNLYFRRMWESDKSICDINVWQKQ